MIKTWAESNFEEAWQLIEFDPAIKSILKKTNFYQQIKNRIMDGNSVTNITGINERDRGQFKFRMSDVFHESITESFDDTPIRYILKTTQRLVEEGKSIENISGNLGRAYRSFASFLRDYDAFYKIKKIVNEIKEDINIEILQDAELDARFHADILLKYQNFNRKMKFMIWLYQKTERSLDKISDRVSGNRGSLPNGIHLLVPIKTDIIENIKKKKTQLKRVRNYLDKTREQLNTKKNNPRVSNITLRKLKAKCVRYETEIKKINKQLKSYKDDANKIEDINNWLLYSTDYLKSIVEKCLILFKNQSLPEMDYNTVQEKFLFPRKALSSVFLFHKPFDMKNTQNDIKLIIEMENCIPIKKIAKIIECTYSDLNEIIEDLLKEKKIDGEFVDELEFKFTTDIDIVIENLIKKLEKL